MRITQQTAIGIYDSIDGPLGVPTANDLTDFANAVAAHVLDQAATEILEEAQENNIEHGKVSYGLQWLRGKANVLIALSEGDRYE